MPRRKLDRAVSDGPNRAEHDDLKARVAKLEETLSPNDDAAKPVTRADVRLLIGIILAVAVAAFVFGVWLTIHTGHL